MSEHYILSTRDKALLSSAADLLKKVAAAETTKPAQMVTVAKLLHILSVLPRVTTDLTASVSVCCPRHKFSEIETFHWWDFGIEDDRLIISSGGHFNDPKTGGDTFTTMEWEAVPEEPAELNDYRESLWMVPDVGSFPEGVASIDLAAGGYTIGILDDDNPLLEGNDEEEIEGEDTDVEADEDAEKDEDVGEEKPRNWSMRPVDAAEARLATLVDPDQVDAKEPAYAYGVESCNQCGCALAQRGLHVDGCLRGDTMWSNMCADCFGELGKGIGWGQGQLYARQPGGEWRFVAGWEPEDASDSIAEAEARSAYRLVIDSAVCPDAQPASQTGSAQAATAPTSQVSPEQQELGAKHPERSYWARIQTLFCVYLLVAVAITIHVPVVQRNIPQHIKDLTAVYRSCVNEEGTYSDDECDGAIEDYSAAHIKMWDHAYIWQLGRQEDGSRLNIEWFGYCIRQAGGLLLFCMFGPGVVAYFSRDDKKANKLAAQQRLVESAKSTEAVVEESRVPVDMALEALNAGTVKAVMLPTGSQYHPAVPPGMKVVEIDGDAPGAGWYIYDPTKLRSTTIREAAKAGTHGVLLGDYGESVAE